MKKFFGFVILALFFCKILSMHNERVVKFFDNIGSFSVNLPGMFKWKLKQLDQSQPNYCEKIIEKSIEYLVFAEQQLDEMEKKLEKVCVEYVQVKNNSEHIYQVLCALQEQQTNKRDASIQTEIDN